jgi:hypothetical protein
MSTPSIAKSRNLKTAASKKGSVDSEASDAQKPARPISLKAGTRLVREWRGVTLARFWRAGMGVRSAHQPLCSSPFMSLIVVEKAKGRTLVASP